MLDDAAKQGRSRVHLRAFRRDDLRDAPRAVLVERDDGISLLRVPQYV